MRIVRLGRSVDSGRAVLRGAAGGCWAVVRRFADERYISDLGNTVWGPTRRFDTVVCSPWYAWMNALHLGHHDEAGVF